MIPAMKVRNHPRVNWYPLPGGLVKSVEGNHPQESRIVIEAVHVGSVLDTVPPTGKFEGKSETYEILTKDHAFAKRLAEEFSKHVGETLKQFGNLDVDF
jgi:hypothetical protein